MRVENTEVTGFEAALRGMRNPMNSWGKSDSFFGIDSGEGVEIEARKIASLYLEKKLGREIDLDSEEDWKQLEYIEGWLVQNGIMKKNDDLDIYLVNFIGPNDLDLAQRLNRAGSPHNKFLRQIEVSVDITAPLYLWKELDTYKVGTTANSTSTMHKLASTPITLECFEMDDYINKDLVPYESIATTWEALISECEYLRQRYNETKEMFYWKELIRLLPESWLQTRTWTGNYAILRSIYCQRKNHKLTEWTESIIPWIETLPYSEELIMRDTILTD